MRIVQLTKRSDATTFALSSNSILLLWSYFYISAVYNTYLLTTLLHIFVWYTRIFFQPFLSTLCCIQKKLVRVHFIVFSPFFSFLHGASFSFPFYPPSVVSSLHPTVLYLIFLFPIFPTSFFLFPFFPTSFSLLPLSFPFFLLLYPLKLLYFNLMHSLKSVLYTPQAVKDF